MQEGFFFFLDQPGSQPQGNLGRRITRSPKVLFGEVEWKIGREYGEERRLMVSTWSWKRSRVAGLTGLTDINFDFGVYGVGSHTRTSLWNYTIFSLSSLRFPLRIEIQSQTSTPIFLRYS